MAKKQRSFMVPSLLRGVGKLLNFCSLFPTGDDYKSVRDVAQPTKRMSDFYTQAHR
jgi:hypothetical protein